MKNTLLIIIFISLTIIPVASSKTISLFPAVLDSTESVYDSSLMVVTNIGYAKEILKKYIFAIGSEDLLRTVNDRITQVKGLVEGVETKVMFFQKAPNKLFQKMVVGEVVQEIIFDGSRGIKIIGNTRQDITGDDLIKLSFDAIMNLILDPESFDVKLGYEGLERINERDAYKIALTLPNDAVWFQYYDMGTGLKIRDTKDIITPQGKFQQITEFDDYRTINGIRYPFTIKQYLGNQTMDFSVESIEVNTGIADEVFIIE